MTITIDQLIQILMKEETDDAGVRAVVTALRDELTSVSRLRDVQRVFEEILAPREGGSREAGGPTREDEKAVEAVGDKGPVTVNSPATAPAPAPCLWRVHHETRNGPLYVSQCDGEWRHATADPKCPSCKKEIFFVTDPAPAVCVWVPQDEGPAHEIWKTGCGTMYERAKSTGWCGKCKAPIKFTEAKT